MKKVISILIAVIIAVLPLCAGFSVFAKGSDSNNSLNEFINEIVELTHEYDANKEFSVKDGIDSVQTYSLENNGDEYTLHDFQTARLIVRANKKFDDFAALKHVSGFEDFHILQYESPKVAMDAYKIMQTDNNVISASPDIVINGCTGDVSEIISQNEASEGTHLCDWSTDRTQSKRLLDYMDTHSISQREIVVALIDSGIDYNHEFLKERVVRTYFNSSADGNKDDELDNTDVSHGTAVSSVIVDNTPENIKVSAFRVFNNDMTSNVSQIAAGYIAAIESNPDIINASLTHPADKSGLLRACLQRAYSKNIPIFASVGNTGRYDSVNLPANTYGTIGVSATDKDNTVPTWNSWSVHSAVSAPGQDVIVAISNNQYRYWRGTSFASPCAAALGAILKSVNPDITVDEIRNTLKNTSFNVKRFNEALSSEGENLDNYNSLYDGVGMIQFCNAFGLEKLTAPEINLEDKVYVGDQTCNIICTDNDAIVLYTTDGTYPAVDNAKVYTEPFEITKRTRIRAVAYYKNGGYYSDEVEVTPRIQYIDSDENFVIDKNGIISLYKGNITNLYIPEVINDIFVTGIAPNAFNTSDVVSLTLPDGITDIPQRAFYRNNTLEYICGNGIKKIDVSSFEESHIMYAEFPNAKEICESAFVKTKSFCYGDFSSVEKIGNYAFGYSEIILFNGSEVTEAYNSIFSYCNRLESVCLSKCEEFIPTATALFENSDHIVDVKLPLIIDLCYEQFDDTYILRANFPKLESIDSDTFANCRHLSKVDLPLLFSVPDYAFSGGSDNHRRRYSFDNARNVGNGAFGKSNTIRAEFSHLETAQSLPQTEKCIISLPSTFKECTEDTKGRNYKVYGTKGTYAEQWANENGHTFIEVSQDTAVLTPLPEKYTDADGVLTADVIGFNRTYQWYGSFTADNTAGTPIDGATDKDFNPIDYPAYPYYYCVVTSTDVGYDPIEIRTNVTENTTYQSADYTEYNKAVEQAKALDCSLYTDLTELDEALSADISGLSNSQQNIVDEQTAKIKAALDNLVLKPADYSRVNEQINTVPEHLEYYTDETVNALNKILNGIDYGLDITKQEVVNSYAEQLQNAISALEYKPADYTEYDKAVAKAKGLDKEKYVDFSQVEKKLAVDVGSRNITQQEEVDLQTKAILAAIDALEEKSQKQPIINPEQDKTNGSTTPDKPGKNGSMISPMTGSETYTGAFTALAALSFATVLLVRKKKDN